jgi:hypothetical protein
MKKVSGAGKGRGAGKVKSQKAKSKSTANAVWIFGKNRCDLSMPLTLGKGRNQSTFPQFAFFR